MVSFLQNNRHIGQKLLHPTKREEYKTSNDCTLLRNAKKWHRINFTASQVYSNFSFHLKFSHVYYFVLIFHFTSNFHMFITSPYSHRLPLPNDVFLMTNKYLILEKKLLEKLNTRWEIIRIGLNPIWTSFETLLSEISFPNFLYTPSLSGEV